MSDEPLAMLRLLQISDSAFPSGSFAFSGGLETLAADGLVTDVASLDDFLRGQAIPRWAGMDRWFIRKARDAAPDAKVLADLDRFCEAHVAVEALGEASRRVGLATLTTHSRMGTPGAAAYRARVVTGEVHGHAPIVQGLIGSGLALPAGAVDAGALYSAVNSVATAAIRLGIVGALEAQTLLAGLGIAMAEALAAEPPLLPSAFTPLADIAVSRRAGQAGRLFSS
ncbi:MAG: urease accessory protein UreF [Bauldia sp.]|nr:urease accessory protein UreF [Bauldia sp.]